MEDNNLIEIPNFNNYKLDKVKNEVFSTITNKYIKNQLTPSKTYYIVQLWKNNKGYKFNLDKVVYFSHNPSIDINTLEIYHLDRNNLNNNIENLQNIIDNKSLVDIKGFPKYKFNLNTNEVYGLKCQEYLTNKLHHTGYYNVTLRPNKNLVLHRLVYQCNNPNEDISLFQIDHIDHNRTNNNIENLRVATRSENMCNKVTRKDNTSGYKNICKIGNSYKVTITKDKKIYRKSFTNLADAILQRDMKLIELHGKFACIE